MSIQPLPQALITAHQLREEAKRLILIAQELEASVEPRPTRAPAVWPYGEVKEKRRSKR